MRYPATLRVDKLLMISEFAARGKIFGNFAFCTDCLLHLLARQYSASGMRSLARYPAFLLKHSRTAREYKTHSHYSLFLRIRYAKNNT